MSEQDNVDIVRRQIEALNHHDLPAVDRYNADSFKSWAIGSPDQMDKRGYSDYVRRFVDAFPDLHFDINDIVAQGDKVAVAWVVRGTHTGTLVGPGSGPVPATNRKIEIYGSSFYELKKNLVVRQDINWDQVTLMTQLGLMAPQGQSSQSSRPGSSSSRSMD